ncbi:hypothetical protein DSO57_1001504 [Entomophthora muscae]|uniref:Uncharacterized protein n=1 Tax=Entomophthora muscae TaxID=34485 RepID=A0ACC2UTT8_9FUNG|nr:hypothetical protein DSO57_1001504 [Entomophthora muscae]
MGRLSTGIKLVGTRKNLANAPELIVQYRQQTGQQRGEGKATVRNIPDNNFLEDNILCPINLKSQNKKLQQFPLIGETAAKQQVLNEEIKNLEIQKFGFYTRPRATRPAARRLPAPITQPASRGWRTLHSRTVHPRQIGKLPNWETQKGNFPKPKCRGKCCPNLESTKFGGVDRLLCKTLNAVIAEVEFECMKVPGEASKQRKVKINNSLLAKPLQSQS